MNGWWHTPISNQSTNGAFIDATKEKLNNEFVGNFALAILDNGKIKKN